MRYASIKLTALAVLLIGAVCMWSCSREGATAEGALTERGADGRIEVSIVGRLQEYGAADESKASLVNSVRVSWSGSGDKVYVYDNKKCLGVLDAVSTDEDHFYAHLTGSIASTESEKLTLVYAPGFSDSEGRPLEDGGVWRYSLASQATPKAPFVVFATMDRAEAVTDKTFRFKFATSVIRVNCAGLVPKAEITGTEITGLNTECILTMSSSGVPTVSGTAPGIISRSGDSGFAKAAGDGTGTFSVAVVPTATSQSDRLLTVRQGEESVSAPFTKGGALKENQSYNTIVLLKKAFLITAVSNNEEWGTVTGGGTYSEGAQVTLNATPKEGYNFAYWTTNGTESGKIPDAGATYTFTVTANATYTAVFKSGGVPKGAVSGLFRVGLGTDGKVNTDDDVWVYFSQGNLYCDFNTTTGKWTKWHFEKHQYDFRIKPYSGYKTALIDGVMTECPSNTCGWFGWSGTGANYDYGFSKGYSGNNTEYAGSFRDWGTAPIEDVDSGWRTLTYQEWEFVVNSRETYQYTGKKSFRKFVKISDAGQNYIWGLILLPDNWWDNHNYDTEKIPESCTKAQINAYGEEGAVYLPMVGYYSGSYNNCYLNSTAIIGRYWTADKYGDTQAYCYQLESYPWTTHNPHSVSENRNKFLNVRLVRNK